MLVVALADAVLMVAALGVAFTRASHGPGGATAGLASPSGREPAGPVSSPVAPAASPAEGEAEGIPGSLSVTPSDVMARPWPARVTAPGPWSASLTGKGDRVTFTTAGTVVGGIGSASVDLGATDPRPPPPPPSPAPSTAAASEPSSNRVLILPGGAQWYPLGRVKLEGQGDIAFGSSTTEGSADADGFTAATAAGATVKVAALSFEALIGRAKPGVTGIGTFVQPEGRQVDRLALPRGTRLVNLCRAEAGASLAPCPGTPSIGVEVAATPGLTIRAAGNGEAAVAGQARANALGRSWDGLVVAIESQGLRATATYADAQWTVTANGAAARQVWVDVWPVIDTKLSARSFATKPGFFDRGPLLRIQWTNVGFATSQVFEAEGVGSGAPKVGFRLNNTLGHDAGVGVRRADRVVNLKGGGDIDSNQAPGEKVDRELSYASGTTASIVLRGNFPDVSVPLAIPST